ncbi:MAG TPA: hypothetical protein VMH30_13230 [Verrucomicrobiae bacterium]|nr:hypothetical protein [Verrucomicrobiae bacterium]
MKINELLAVCGIASALCLGAATVSAQDNGGGGGGGGGFGGGGGGFDPAAFQQRMMDNIRDQLNFTNDTDWSAVQPLVQKVLDARREAGNGGMGRMMFRRRNNNGDENGGGGGRRGGFFGTPSPEAQALQSALDNNAPSDQIKDLLAKYEASQKAKQAALKAAQENLRAVLTPRQEAQATLLGLLD